MCGITGIFEFDSLTLVRQDVIEAMNAVIIYRGPDDGGSAAGNGYGMGARRLAIQDLSINGHMPMQSDDGRYFIVFNGEVYNFKDIREKLIAEGITFHTGTDTEVILKAYIHWGPPCLKLFNGMFAFVIYDTEQKKVFIARDRLGIKPLYYSVNENKLVIGSEIKCLWIGGVVKTFDHTRFSELFILRYVAGENTIYEGVKRLLPGHYMELSEGRLKITQWWKLSDFAGQNSKNKIEDPVKWYRETFDDSVRIRKISDVPVGVLLSGGLDSSSVAASLSQGSEGQRSSFTVRFAEDKYDEGDLARLVADKYNFDFNQLYLDPEKIYSNTIEILRNNDEPIVHASDIFVKEISKYAKSKVTVLLSGEGGDETLGGYVRYNPLRFVGLLQIAFSFKSVINLLPIKRNRINKLIRMLSLNTVDNFIIYNSSEILPDEMDKLGMIRKGNISYRQSVLSDAKKVYPNDPLRQVMHYDMHTYLCSLLDRNDFMTMRSSIECRVPFLDYRLVEGLASLPSSEIFRDGSSKSLLRAALGDRLPNEILNARKWGFGVPWKKYYREDPEFRNYLLNISGHPLVIEHFSSPAKINNLVNAFLNGDDSQYFIANQLVNICLWYDVNFEEKATVITQQKKLKRIYYVGNFLVKHGLNPNINLSLISRLRNDFEIINASDKKSKWARLLEMVTILLRQRKETDMVMIDVYSTDGFWYAYILATIAKRLKIPYVNILHGGNLPVRLNNSKALSESLFGNAAKNISPSRYLEKVFKDTGFQVEYLPNFIDLESYPYKERKNLSYTLFWLRAFDKIYNPVLAVKVLKGLVDKGHDAKLCMVGPDKDGTMQETKHEAERLKISDRVQITGRLDKEEWIRRSNSYDVFINTTNIDNHPVSVIEAMALGLPVVSTNVGGLPYLIESGTNGILVPADDADAFVHAIEGLVNDPEKTRQISRNARKKVDEFTWPVLKEQWLDTIGRVGA